ncbi:Cell division protein FtsL [Pararobbsia alpina]|uniref:Cell division protein FtsL n=1 Tax=Pararobbsia alpina TaxID=621374 RepID=A0A6S7B2M4_9BURK|nr:Cell division protein FtsL [Pararobbsia alpina]
MSRLNFLLLLIVTLCALSVVNATNRQRELFIALGRGQMQERQLQQELARLQYQQSALSKTTRVEGVATSDLEMQPVTAGRTQYLTVAGASVTAPDDGASGPASTGSNTGASNTGASNTANASEIAGITSGTASAGASSPAGSSAGSSAGSTAQSAAATSSRATRASGASAAAAGASQ